MEVLIFYGLAIVSVIITLGAQAYIKSCYSKYQKVNTEKGLTGEQVARRLLDKHGLQDIKVQQVSGYLSDHYDPKGRVIRLSQDIFSKSSIASVSVACHECGHAIQDKNKFVFLRIRSSLVPVVNLCSYAGYIAIILGGILSMMGLIWAGIIAEMVILLFQLVTLPVEFDASKRGLKEVKEEKFLNDSELKGGKKMLTSAALTYVASVATAIIQVLRLVLIYGRRND
jgi:Zn-dependent membrane protease YugP